jgi:hypothetical protein
MINYVLDQFNFGQAVEILKMMQETYGSDTPKEEFDSDEPYIHRVSRVPSVQSLMKEARRLLETTIKEDLQFIEAGHLAAYKFKYTDKPGHYSLKLALDTVSWDKDTDDLIENEEINEEINEEEE